MAEIEITRVSELDALEAVADEDLLAIVDDPSGASQTKKITREDFLGSAPIVATSGVTGDLTGNVTGDVTGNSDTATALETARTIGGTYFDGTANIEPATAVNHSGTYAHDQAVATTSSPTFAAVTSGSSALKWKVLAGTFDADGYAGVVHGLDASTFAGGIISVFNSSTSGVIGPNATSSADNYAIQMNFSSTQITLYCGDSLNNKNFRLVVFYV